MNVDRAVEGIGSERLEDFVLDVRVTRALWAARLDDAVAEAVTAMAEGVAREARTLMPAIPAGRYAGSAPGSADAASGQPRVTPPGPARMGP